MADQIYFNGDVRTQDVKNPFASAFAIKNGIFYEVGPDAEILLLKNTHTEVIDLHKKIVFPGFNDAHIHLWKVGNLITHLLDLRGVKSISEMQEKIAEHAQKNPELLWIQARGFNESVFPDKKMPDKTDLDAILTDRPICVTRTCAHQIIVNSKALEICGINKQTPIPAGGEIKLFADGEVAGHFTETAIGLILKKIPKYSPEQLREMILAAQEKFLKYGITSAADPAVEKDLLEVYKNMDKAGEIKLRLHLFPIRVPDGSDKIYPIPQKYQSDHLIINTVKFFADGGLSGRTAAMSEPYLNTNEFGVLRLDKLIFKELARETQDAGFRIAVHTIGDVAIDMVLDVFQEIASGNKNNIKHRLKHVGFPSAAHLKIMQQLNVSAVMQPIFIFELGRNFKENLSHSLLEKVYPLRDILQKKINVALSTDAPVVKNFDPLFNINCAINRKADSGETISPDQRISFEEALFAYTMGSANATDRGEMVGSISKNKLADFILLDGEFPGSLQISKTYIGGKCCYTRE